MVAYREILRLSSFKYGNRMIAASVHSSRNTILEVLELAEMRGICRLLESDVSNERLQCILYLDRLVSPNPRKMPDYEHVHREQAKPGVDLTLLWIGFCINCKDTGNTPYMHTQFCDNYQDWAKTTKATMCIQHKPGDAMQVDGVGNTLEVQDPVTDEPVPAKPIIKNAWNSTWNFV